MEYNNAQLKAIQKCLIAAVKKLEEEKGFGAMCAYADFAIWLSHANLAGFNVEKATGKMYRDNDNVRTYYA